MYTSYFGFREIPFSVTPDPRLFYTNQLYQEALAALLYGIKNKKGFIVITGDVGTGKTTLLRKLIRNLEATEHCVLIFNTHLSFLELLQLILHDLQLTNKGKNKLAMLQELNQYLIEQHKKGHTVTLLIDEAQNLADETLEGLRLLSNLETDKEKFLQIVLMGQPELDIKLNQPSLRQLKQRVAVRCSLNPLAKKEVVDYIRHRMQLAGYDGPEIFSNDAIQAIGHYSRGTPRLINIICDNALLTAYATSQKTVSANTISEVARDLHLETRTDVNFKDKEDSRTKPSKVESGDVPVSRPTPANNGNGKKLEPPPVVRDDERFLHVGSVLPRRTPPAQPGSGRKLNDEPSVSATFIDMLSRALTEAMGPMAPLVIRDRIAALGESPQTFPARRVLELVELISHEILSDKLKINFQQKISQEIREFTLPL
jgi:type II secretory pathway predicted ATPase ExeA